MLEYHDIVRANERIAIYKNPTPLQYSGTLSRMTGNKIFLKPENLQLTGSFKLGGAINTILNLVDKGEVKGVVTCSAGNWAQAVAFAATRFNIKAVIVMPEGASPVKIRATEGYGAKVIIYGKNSNDVAEKAKDIAHQEGLIFLSPFDDEDVISGHGVVGIGIIREKPDTDIIVCPVGSGAFIAGILIALKEKYPGVKIIGVEPVNANSMQLSLKAGKIVEKDNVDTIADGLALKKPGENPFQIVKKYIDDIVTVNENEIKEAVSFLLERTKLLVEPSGAVSVAALMNGKVVAKNKNIVAILSGGNLDLDRMIQLLKDRGK